MLTFSISPRLQGVLELMETINIVRSEDKEPRTTREAEFAAKLATLAGLGGVAAGRVAGATAEAAGVVSNAADTAAAAVGHAVLDTTSAVYHCVSITLRMDHTPHRGAEHVVPHVMHPGCANWYSAFYWLVQHDVQHGTNNVQVQPADNALDDMDEEEAALGSLHSLGRQSLGGVATPEPPVVETAAPSRCSSTWTCRTGTQCVHHAEVSWPEMYMPGG